MIVQVFFSWGKIQMEIEAENYIVAVMGAGTMGRGIANSGQAIEFSELVPK